MASKILKSIANIKTKRCIIQKHAKYLISGEYVIDDSLSFIYLKNDDNASRLLKNNYSNITMSRSGFRTLINAIIRSLFFRSVLIAASTEDKPFFQGVLLQFGCSKKEHKVYDLINKKVLLIFPDKHSYDRKIKHYEQFCSHFPVPDLLACNEKELLIIEAFIPAKEVSRWSHSDYIYVLMDAFDRETAYMRNCKENNVYSLIQLGDLIQSVCSKSPVACYALNNISKKAIEEKYPFINLHGDLWSSNILISKSQHGKVYYIDWEKSRPYVFFYDIFYLFLNECFIKHNFTYTENYMSGEYDDILKDIFQIFGIQFRIEHRIDYLYITLLIQYMERWITKKKSEKRKLVKQWKQIFHRITDMYNYVVEYKQFNR